MSEERTSHATELLRRMAAGEAAAGDGLLSLLYDELHGMAHRQMARQPADHTLETTALVNEAWIKLVDQKQAGWENRGHFIRVAATAMRSVLVDYARARRTQKRGDGRRRLQLEEGVAMAPAQSALVLALDESLKHIAQADEQIGRIAELRCFGGLTNAEVARALGVTERTVERGWRTARLHLQRDLDPGEA